jgi:hypothetical protein
MFIDPAPDECLVSGYADGDAYNRFISGNTGPEREISCDVGLATGLLLYRLSGSGTAECTLSVPLGDENPEREDVFSGNHSCARKWKDILAEQVPLSTGDQLYEQQFDTVCRSLILHSPGDTLFAGPYTYRSFWFRDAVYALYALLAAGFHSRARRLTNALLDKQGISGQFSSQDGEWDSNGQMLWIMHTFLRFTGTAAPPSWERPVRKAASWILRKISSNTSDGPELKGLLPPGYSAEHFGPNDYYYWDDFWSAAGLFCAADMLEDSAPGESGKFREQGSRLMEHIERSIRTVTRGAQDSRVPVSPNRRFDSAAVGSLSAGYPLRLWQADDPRLADTARALMDRYRSSGAFYHAVSHSGINPYLSLHIAQVFLRAGEGAGSDIFEAVTGLASPTGQWPEAIHPKTKTGCMGDGQHIWAASEWLLMFRNCLLREDGKRLVFASGLRREWFGPEGEIRFGPAPTEFGRCTLRMKREKSTLDLQWEASWHEEAPHIDIAVPGTETIHASGTSGRHRVSW